MPLAQGKGRADAEERGRNKKRRISQVDSAHFGWPSPDIFNLASETHRTFPAPKIAVQPAEITSHIELSALGHCGSYSPGGAPYDEFGLHLDVHTQWTDQEAGQHPAYGPYEDPNAAQLVGLPVNAVDLEDGVGKDLVFQACSFLAMHDPQTGAHYAWLCLKCDPPCETFYSTWLAAK